MKEHPPVTPSGDEFGASFNDRFQQALSLPETKTKYAALNAINSDFVTTAVTYGKVLITELFLPAEAKTIRPVAIGGRAGGVKYLLRGILFKLADGEEGGVYEGSDDAAAKAMGHEIVSANSYFRCAIPGLHLALQVLIDYKGFRMHAQAELPIDTDTLRVGTADCGETVHGDDKHLSKKLQFAAQELNLRKHFVKKVSLFTACDVEGHCGRDNRYYVVDLARAFPPESPFVWHLRRVRRFKVGEYVFITGPTPDGQYRRQRAVIINVHAPQPPPPPPPPPPHQHQNQQPDGGGQDHDREAPRECLYDLVIQRDQTQLFMVPESALSNGNQTICWRALRPEFVKSRGRRLTTKYPETSHNVRRAAEAARGKAIGATGHDDITGYFICTFTAATAAGQAVLHSAYAPPDERLRPLINVFEEDGGGEGGSGGHYGASAGLFDSAEDAPPPLPVEPTPSHYGFGAEILNVHLQDLPVELESRRPLVVPMNLRDDPTETVARHMRAHEQRATIVHMGATASLYDDRGERGRRMGGKGLQRRKRSQSDLSVFLPKPTTADDDADIAAATSAAPTATAAAAVVAPTVAVRSYQEILMASSASGAGPAPLESIPASPSESSLSRRAQRRRSNSLNASDLLTRPDNLSSSRKNGDADLFYCDEGPALTGRIPYKWKEATYDTDLSPSNLLPTAIFGPALSPDCFTEFAQGDPQEDEMNVDARDASVVLVDLLVPAMAKVRYPASEPASACASSHAFRCRPCGAHAWPPASGPAPARAPAEPRGAVPVRVLARPRR